MAFLSDSASKPASCETQQPTDPLGATLIQLMMCPGYQGMQAFSQCVAVTAASGNRMLLTKCCIQGGQAAHILITAQPGAQ
jgi:hypothetical protein